MAGAIPGINYIMIFEIFEIFITECHSHGKECSVFIFYFRIRSRIYCRLSVRSNKKLDFSIQSNSWSLLLWLDSLFIIWYGKETNYLMHLPSDTIHISARNIFFC